MEHLFVRGKNADQTSSHVGLSYCIRPNRTIFSIIREKSVQSLKNYHFQYMDAWRSAFNSTPNKHEFFHGTTLYKP